ncbi:MAG: putative rane protein [Acidimicrobiales bacterium]|nr:putative rane protein [Acidimicrobiales bacterium]
MAVARKNKPLEYACKPAVMLALIGVAAAVHPALGDRRDWFVAALALSMLGDVFLMLPRDLFVPGLASFLLAHVAYVVGLRLHGGSMLTWALAGAGVGAVDVVLARPVLRAVRRRHRDLLVPVALYMFVISTMVAAAVATGMGLAIAGAVLFLASDTLIAWNRFVRPTTWGPLAIIVSYHLGQAGLVLSLAR